MSQAPTGAMPGPMDLQLEAAQIQRRRQLMEVMQAQSMKPVEAPQTKGRFQASISPLNMLSTVMQSYMANRGLTKADTQQADLTKRYTAGMGDAVSNYINTRQGTPGISTPPTTPNDDEGNVNPAITTGGTPANPRAAIVQGLSSGYPALQTVATQDMKDMAKGTMTPKDILTLGEMDPQTRIKAAQMLNAGTPLDQVLTLLKPENKFTSAGDTIVQTAGSTPEGQPVTRPTGAGYFGSKYETNPDGSTKVYQIKGADGQLEPYQKDAKTGMMHKMDSAPKVTIHNRSDVNVAGPKAGAEHIFTNAAKTNTELGTAARAAQGVKDTVQRMRTLDEKGIFSNVTTGPATFMSNLAQAMGGSLTKDQTAKLGNTETYNAVSVEAWQKLVSQFGGNRGVTSQEAEKIMEMLPLARNSPQARQQIFQILENSADRQISQFKSSNKALTEAIRLGDPSKWQEQFGEVNFPTTSPGVQPGGSGWSIKPGGR